MSFKSWIESVFDQEADYWVGKSEKGLPSKLKSAINPHRGKNLRVLDLGCGGGRLTASLIPDFQVHGIDYSADLIKRAAEENPQATFSCGSFQIPDSWQGLSEFDIIISNCAIRKDYCSNLARIGKLCKEHLSSNGRLILRIQAFEDLESVLPAGLRQLLFYNEKEIRNHLSIFGKLKIEHETFSQTFSSEEYFRKFLSRINIKYNGPIRDLAPQRHYYLVKT
jgi:2-polyprenyl-3-methyl-5-hydroxy-6-metoxy-1,4-benzoquinol methylase